MQPWSLTFYLFIFRLIDLQRAAFSNFSNPRSVAVASLCGAGEHLVQFPFLPQHQLFLQIVFCLIVFFIWKH